MKYLSGETIEAGDTIRYHSEPGRVEFVVTHKVGNASLDWYVDEFPGGGAMIEAHSFGSVFLGVEDLHDLLEFVSRGAADPKA
jgi:hypothetical protein